MVICLELGADLHMAQLMPLPLTVSCFNKIQIGFTFLVPADPGSPGKRTIICVCVCVCVILWLILAFVCEYSEMKLLLVVLCCGTVFVSQSVHPSLCHEVCVLSKWLNTGLCK